MRVSLIPWGWRILLENDLLPWAAALAAATRTGYNVLRPKGPVQEWVGCNEAFMYTSDPTPRAEFSIVQQSGKFSAF